MLFANSPCQLIASRKYFALGSMSSKKNECVPLNLAFTHCDTNPSLKTEEPSFRSTRRIAGHMLAPSVCKVRYEIHPLTKPSFAVHVQKSCILFATLTSQPYPLCSVAQKPKIESSFKITTEENTWRSHPRLSSF